MKARLGEQKDQVDMRLVIGGKTHCKRAISFQEAAQFFRDFVKKSLLANLSFLYGSHRR